MDYYIKELKHLLNVKGGLWNTLHHNLQIIQLQFTDPSGRIFKRPEDLVHCRWNLKQFHDQMILKCGASVEARTNGAKESGWVLWESFIALLLNWLNESITIIYSIWSQRDLLGIGSWNENGNKFFTDSSSIQYTGYSLHILVAICQLSELRYTSNFHVGRSSSCTMELEELP